MHTRKKESKRAIIVKRMERLLWSIAFPGFGQLLNKQFIKGLLFISLEILVNYQAHFNQIIPYSFQGYPERAIAEANINWLLFYPCIYFFSMWDAYRNAGEPVSRFSYLPFVFCAYFVTLGLLLSSEKGGFGSNIGPVFFPILCVIPGIFLGLLLKWACENIWKPGKNS